MNIYVGNVAHASTEEGLKQLFEQYGHVVSVRIMKDKFTGASRGFAFVEMANEDEAMQAIEALNETAFDGRTLRISKANPPAERSSRPSRPFTPRGDRGGDRGGFDRGGGRGRF
jgi:RNA recognition motif-containing protein